MKLVVKNLEHFQSNTRDEQKFVLKIFYSNGLWGGGGRGGLNQFYPNSASNCAKNPGGWVDGPGWVEVIAVLRIVYCNKNCS